MPLPTRPAPAKTFQNENVVFLSAVASYQTALTAAEATAASSLDITLMIFGDWGRPAQNTNRVSLARRLGDGAVYEQIGTTNYTGGDLRYSFRPQDTTGSDGRKAYEKFPEGTTGFLMQRLGVAIASNFIATQRVNLFPVAFGPQMPMPSSDGEEQETVILQSFAITGPPKFDLAIS